MKKSISTIAFLMLFLSVIVSSCSVITGIFKAGMGFGIFIVVFIIAVIIVVIVRAGKK